MHMHGLSYVRSDLTPPSTSRNAVAVWHKLMDIMLNGRHVTSCPD